ncbi:MAG TPA: hypothetical protein VGS02_04900 [Acidobacteriaceae bacterium]|nr:hypothetical protein [Acidobacteriaceae bacterium]
MSDSKRDDPNQYAADVLNLHASLDVLTAEDDAQSTTRALIEARQRYFELVFRRLSLDFDQKQAAVALWMLDVVQARLTSLERLRGQKSRRAATRVRK